MNQIKYKTKWDLSEYYSGLDDPKLEEDISKIMPMIDDFVSKYKGKIKYFQENDFLEFFEDENKISKHIMKIHFYLGYLSSLDTQNQIVIRKEGEIDFLMVEVENKLLFISQEFKEIGYEKLIVFSNLNILKDYKNYFFQKANNIKYLLDEKIEYALNLKENSGASAFANLHSELTNSFTFKVNIDGKEKIMTNDEVRSLRQDKREEVRKEAFRSLREVYNDKKVQITLGNTYKAIVKDYTSEVKLRGYKNPMSIRNISEELDDEVVNLLLQEVENSYFLFQRYLKVKAKLLGKDKIAIWDVFAPISNFEKEYSFDDSLNLYLNSIKDFDYEFYNYSIDMFENGRVDVFPNKGKRGGAFASFSQGFESFILLNHTNKIRDVSTLAHELGHAIHGHLRQNQKPQVYSPGLCLEETASIFNEMLLSEKLKESMNDDEKIYFLDKKLEDIFSTIFRQIQYILFEKRVHETILSGKELTYEDFNKIWREEQVKMSGHIEYDVEAKDESGWSMIPHIFRTPFYCYAYAFGNLLTFALYQKYKEEGKPFVEKYKNILRSGGSKTPYDLLMENGIDIKSKEYFKKGIKVVEDMVEEFERLA